MSYDFLTKIPKVKWLDKRTHFNELIHTANKDNCGDLAT